MVGEEVGNESEREREREKREEERRRGQRRRLGLAASRQMMNSPTSVGDLVPWVSVRERGPRHSRF